MTGVLDQVAARPVLPPRQRAGDAHVLGDAACMAALFAADLVAFVAAQTAALFLADLVRNQMGQQVPALSLLAQIQPEIQTLAALFCSAMAYLTARGCYRERLPFWVELRLFVLVSTLALLAEAFIEVALKNQPSRLVLIGGWILFPPAVAVLRPLAKRALAALGLWRVPVLVIGDAAGIANVAAVFGSEGVSGYEVVATCAPEQALALAERDGWASLLRQEGARRLTLSIHRGSTIEPRLIQSILRAGLPFVVLPPVDVLPVVGCERIPFFSHDTLMLSYRNNLAQPAARLAKTAFDLLLSSLLLAALSPLFLLVVLLVRRDGGPAFFSHRRIGAHGRTFGCLKFRTMVPNADEVLLRALAADEALAAEWDATQKLRHDPRITGIGRVLRATSLDELPQLVNVVRLEMSLVGPRPIVKAEVARYGDDIAFYYEARPGLTGLWQVSGRADTSYIQRVRLDCWYVKNWTMWHDVAILSKTVPAVLSRRGAH